MAPDFPPEATHDVPLDEQLRHDLSSLTCRREGQTMALTEMSVASLGCGRLAVEGIAGGCVVLLLLCAAVVCWRRQYETKILLFWVYRHCKEACCTKPIVVYKKEEVTEGPVAADEHYDVFVSVDEKDDVALTWVIQVLLPLLEKRDLPLSVYLPARQELPGECKAEARANAIVKSRNTLVLITPGYSRNPWCRYEFDHACRHLEEHNAGKFVLLRMADKNDDDDDDDDDNDNDEIANKNGEDNDVEDGKKDRPCPDCVKAGGGQQAVVYNGNIQYNDGNDADDIRRHDNHGGGDFVEAPNGDVPRKEARDLGEDRAAGDDKPKNDRRELITIPDNRAGNKLCGAWCIGHGRSFHLPHLWRRQQRPDEKTTPPRRQRAHKLARYCESGDHMIAVEPLNTYIAERRFWHIGDRLLKQKLLYELSVVKKQTPAFV
ncbi:hypothetical protein C0Q70_09901 [Pomacea canaliculata]|uniref:TIR domain-containing protein n=1 Tax=Pomacea canaliculata TaxID=400727 RepID=A0A2T7PB39_POMCA|nr:hypothetical protein C0Q70_09901 [Pomacea canaliculata]